MESAAANSPFPTTRWTMVFRLRDANDQSGAERVLADLCRDYWYPLYAFARRKGCNSHDAEDATQGFFAHLLGRNLFASAEPNRGKLRTYLLAAFEHFLADAWDRAHAQKRGGGCEIVSIDLDEGERRYGSEPLAADTPDSLFDRSWAMTVVRAALAALAADEARAGRAALFRECEPFLSPERAGEASYAAIAERLGLSENAAWQAVSRLRKRFRAIVRQQIADTLQSPDAAQIEDELASLRAALCD